MDYPWIVHGLSMDSRWTIQGLSIDNPWGSRRPTYWGGVGSERVAGGRDLGFCQFCCYEISSFFYYLFSISLLLTECHRFSLVFIDFVAFCVISWIFRCFVLFHVLNKTLQKLTSPKSFALNLREKIRAIPCNSVQTTCF